jgi:hypothetical protein
MCNTVTNVQQCAMFLCQMFDIVKNGTRYRVRVGESRVSSKLNTLSDFSVKYKVVSCCLNPVQPCPTLEI